MVFTHQEIYDCGKYADSTNDSRRNSTDDDARASSGRCNGRGRRSWGSRRYRDRGTADGLDDELCRLTERAGWFRRSGRLIILTCEQL